jgi:hypothetical protein
MSISSPLVADPVLRRALRRLYPEMPAALQRLLILSPHERRAHDAFHPFATWPSAVEATAALEDTRRRVGVPPTHEDAKESFATKRVHMRWDSLAIDRHRDLVIGVTSGSRGEVLEIVTEHLGGTPCYAVASPGYCTASSIIADGGEVHVAREPTLLRRTVRKKKGALVLLADGTPHVVHRAQRGWEVAQASMATDHDASVRDLVRRWSNVANAADRERIARFWLGHEHPTLSAAGMATLAHTPRVRHVR